MKNIVLFLITCFWGCTLKHETTVGFIRDSTLQLKYSDIEATLYIDSNSILTQIISDTMAFNIVKAEIDNLIKNGMIGNQYPLSINLVNDSIWLIQGNLSMESNKIVFGKTVYFELEKKSGHVTKRIIEN
jgi:hypothetical protein